MTSSASVPAPSSPDDRSLSEYQSGTVDHAIPDSSTFSHQRIMDTVQRSQPDGGKKDVERMPFKATPEVISQFLELKVDEVLTQMQSVGGREQLFVKLMEHEEYLRKIHDFNPEELRRQLEVAGEAVSAKEKFMKDVTSPEKKTMMRRAWDRMKGFALHHPIIAVLLMACLVAGGYATWHYAGNTIMAWLHGFAETAPADVLRRATEAPPIIPAPPPAPSGPWHVSPLPPGLG
ncbi:MAG: hypothetical protein WC353_02805 [Candidatus Peribacter sp.]|jgi:hypothetical protein